MGILNLKLVNCNFLSIKLHSYNCLFPKYLLMLMMMLMLLLLLRLRLMFNKGVDKHFHLLTKNASQKVVFQALVAF